MRVRDLRGTTGFRLALFFLTVFGSASLIFAGIVYLNTSRYLSGNPDERMRASAVLIEDRYITGTRFRLRRMTDEETGIVALKLAKKYETSDPTARPMVNAYITAEEYAVFEALPARVIVKRRYELTVGTDLFGIDRFEGSLTGLTLAEVDGTDDASLAAICRPDWAICDVSHDAAFQGGALALLDPQGLVELLAQRKPIL